jgi:hypothetical protein
MSTPRTLRPPLCMVIEETWWTFFTQRAGHAVKYGQQLERTAVGPTGRLVLSMSGYPCRGWYDNSNGQGIITNIMSCGVAFFRPRKEGRFRVSIFLRYVLSKAHRFFGVRCFLALSPSLSDSNVRIAFRATLPPTQNFWVNPLRPFLGWFFLHDRSKGCFPFG